MITVLTHPDDVWGIFDLGDPQLPKGSRFTYHGETYETLTNAKGHTTTVRGLTLPSGGIFPDKYPPGSVAARRI
jgi:hypothetical protein